jgi:tRNA(Arg) A34 adenosine deaminase TadA
MRPSADAEPEVRDALPLTVENSQLNGEQAPAGCTNASISTDPCDNSWYGKNNPLKLSPQAIQQRDDMYALLSLAMVNEDWQVSQPEAAANANLKVLPRRGHNVGGVLVDDRGQLVWWDRNSNGFECSGTNHGETRMMISYLKFSRRSTLNCHTIYTSLEPCAMCSGVMTLQNIGRTIYVQKDHGFGAAVERLQLPHRGANAGREFACGYPRTPISRQGLKTGAALELDRAFHTFAATNPGDVTAFLQTPAAHGVYIKAENDLLAIRPLPGNESAYQDAIKFLSDQRAIYANTFTTPEMHVAIERNRANSRAAHPGAPENAAAFRPDFKTIAGQLDPCCRPRTLSGDPIGLPFVNPQQPLPAFCPAVFGSAAGAAAQAPTGQPAGK